MKFWYVRSNLYIVHLLFLLDPFEPLIYDGMCIADCHLQILRGRPVDMDSDNNDSDLIQSAGHFVSYGAREFVVLVAKDTDHRYVCGELSGITSTRPRDTYGNPAYVRQISPMYIENYPVGGQDSVKKDAVRTLSFRRSLAHCGKTLLWHY